VANEEAEDHHDHEQRQGGDRVDEEGRDDEGDQVAHGDRRQGRGRDQLCAAADERREELLQAAHPLAVLRGPARLQERLGEVVADACHDERAQSRGLPRGCDLEHDGQEDQTDRHHEQGRACHLPRARELDDIGSVRHRECCTGDQDQDYRLDQPSGP
jgi:hypothetical protein